MKTLALWLAPAAAFASTINLTYIKDGNMVPGTQVKAGKPPADAVGGGDLETIMKFAAASWMRAILDDYSLSVSFGWGDAGGVNAFTRITETGGTPNRPKSASIVFDNQQTPWFLDKTPDDSTGDYTDYKEFSKDLGGGKVNTGRVYMKPLGDAAKGYDAVTIATHELGHALGLYPGSARLFNLIQLTGAVQVSKPRPHPGTKIPMVYEVNKEKGLLPDGHIDPSDDELKYALMVPGGLTALRQCISEVDILGVAEVSQFEKLNTNPKAPEPAGFAILGSGLITLALGGQFIRQARRG